MRKCARPRWEMLVLWAAYITVVLAFSRVTVVLSPFVVCILRPVRSLSLSSHPVYFPVVTYTLFCCVTLADLHTSCVTNLEDYWRLSTTNSSRRPAAVSHGQETYYLLCNLTQQRQQSSQHGIEDTGATDHLTREGGSEERRLLLAKGWGSWVVDRLADGIGRMGRGMKSSFGTVWRSDGAVPEEEGKGVGGDEKGEDL
ncbi:hypothetical protein GE09DRAFT_459465 [Coniochaeta sp. 2T2.1]|nr:hypothetical protein GE09DRAFT_459465 [Coniochaeta sp. 2T2.1]